MTAGAPPPIVFTTADQKRGLDALQERLAESRATGGEFVIEPPPLTHAQQKLADWNGIVDVPTIAANDSRAFLRNLDKIAKGEVRVTED